MIFIHFFVHSALIISCDLAQRVKISMIFFNAFSNCLVYSFMHQCLISWFNNDFDICSFRILMNFSSFIIFQLQRDFRADSLQTLKFIIVYINKWDWQQDLSVHDVDYESFDSILCLNRSQKSQEISIQRSSNDVRTLRDQKSRCAEFSFMQQHSF